MNKDKISVSYIIPRYVKLLLMGNLEYSILLIEITRATSFFINFEYKTDLRQRYNIEVPRVKVKVIKSYIF